MRYLLIMILGISSTSLAETIFKGFRWNRDSKWELQVFHNGHNIFFYGNMREWEPTRLWENYNAIELHPYKEGFMSVALTFGDDESGSVFLLERQSGVYRSLLKQPIVANPNTIVRAVDGIVEGLNDINNWDPSLSFRVMAEYFEKNPDRHLDDFYDEVELAHVKETPKPETDIAKFKTPKMPEVVPAQQNSETQVTQAQGGSAARSAPVKPKRKKWKQQEEVGQIAQGQPQARKQYQEEPPSRGGWFSGLFGGGRADEPPPMKPRKQRKYYQPRM